MKRHPRRETLGDRDATTTKEIGNMPLGAVTNKWQTYRRMIRVVFGSINNPVTIENAIGTIGPLPDDPGDWPVWLNALRFLGNLETAVHVTDQALRRAHEFVVASNKLAAASSLPAPSAKQVHDLIESLNVVSRAIQKDQRFVAALKIAGKLADTIESEMKKP